MQSPNASSIASIITTPMPPASPTTILIAAQLEAGLKKFERMSVKKLSATLGLSIPFVRNALVQHYGVGITFTKGRTGGITLDKDYLIGRNTGTEQTSYWMGGITLDKDYIVGR